MDIVPKPSSAPPPVYAWPLPVTDWTPPPAVPRKELSPLVACKLRLKSAPVMLGRGTAEATVDCVSYLLGVVAVAVVVVVVVVWG